jgi:RND family efflux transporter MFP subunit
MSQNNLLSNLSSLENLSKSPDIQEKRSKRRVPAWLLPFGLFIGFIFVFALLFGRRLLPAVPVQVAPVITIRSDRSSDRAEVSSEVTSVASSTPTPKQLLFQASGWIEPDPFPISVSVLVSGIVEEVNVLEGDTVVKDQILARLIDEDAILDLEEKKARVDTLTSEIEANLSRIPLVESRRSGSVSNIESERGRLAELEDRFHRLRSLPQGSIPAVELASARLKVDQQRSNVDKAASNIPGIDSEIAMVNREIAAKRSTLREAEVAVAKAQLALDRHVIRSPMNGTVLRLHAAPGRKRMLTMDDPKSGYIVELFDPQSLQARIDVPLSEASSLSVGQPVEMTTDLLPNVTLNGMVTRITGEADLQRNTLQVKVAIENPDSRLRPEMLVRGKFFPIPKPVSFTGGKKESRTISGGRLSIYVPQEAIFEDNQVWTISADNTAERRSLTLTNDIRDKHQIAIEGIHSGELVILPPHNKLKPDARVTIIK